MVLISLSALSSGQRLYLGRLPEITDISRSVEVIVEWEIPRCPVKPWSVSYVNCPQVGYEPVLKSKSESSPELCSFNNSYSAYNLSGTLILLSLTSTQRRVRLYWQRGVGVVLTLECKHCGTSSFAKSKNVGAKSFRSRSLPPNLEIDTYS